MPQANPIAKKKLADKAAYKKAVTAKAQQKKGMWKAGMFSNVDKPTPKPKFSGNTDAIGNPTNLRAKYKNAGGKISKAYKACGATVITGRG